MLKIFILGSQNYANWIQARTEVEFVDSVKDADLVFFTGGSDVNPSIYGDVKYRTTYCDEKRDEYESAIYKEALAKKVPMIGVCRGNQYLTAMQPKGFIIQDVTNHGMNHSIKFMDDYTDEEYAVSSTHHQMAYPFNVRNHEIIAYASPRISQHYMTGTGKVSGGIPYETEIVFYKDTKCFGIQWHPEFLSNSNPVLNRTFELVVDRLKLKI